MAGSRRSFTAMIETGNRGGAFVEIPFDVEAAYGTRGQTRIKATFDGHPYRGSLARMGGTAHVLGVRKDVRAAIRKSIGDTVKVVIEPDLEPRIVAAPDDLKKLFADNAAAGDFFHGLSYTHRKEYVRWIEEAKRPETRVRRLDKTIDMLLDRKTR